MKGEFETRIELMRRAPVREDLVASELVTTVAPACKIETVGFIHIEPGSFDPGWFAVTRGICWPDFLFFHLN